MTDVISRNSPNTAIKVAELTGFRDPIKCINVIDDVIYTIRSADIITWENISFFEMKKLITAIKLYFF